MRRIIILGLLVLGCTENYDEAELSTIDNPNAHLKYQNELSLTEDQGLISYETNGDINWWVVRSHGMKFLMVMDCCEGGPTMINLTLDSLKSEYYKGLINGTQADIQTPEQGESKLKEKLGKTSQSQPISKK